jgi:predicted NUDIX family phosphoesterase
LKTILVVERKHLFPRLSPQGFLPPQSLDLGRLSNHLFFAEREYMESNSHYKQIIPYLVLQRGNIGQRRVLAYQRRQKHSERRLGGLWSLGFGGHIEPFDRSEPQVATQGLVEAAALRELAEETGLKIGVESLELMGFINSDMQDVSSVHFGVVYRIDLSQHHGDDEEILRTVSARAEPFQARWLPVAELAQLPAPRRGPDGGAFEDWSHIVIGGIFTARP